MDGRSVLGDGGVRSFKQAECRTVGEGTYVAMLTEQFFKADELKELEMEGGGTRRQEKGRSASQVDERGADRGGCVRVRWPVLPLRRSLLDCYS